MMEITCPRCKALHHSDEEHIGKHLKCVRCGDVVPIAHQDGRFSSKEAQIEVSGRSSSPTSTRKKAQNSASTVKQFQVAISIGAAILVLLVASIYFSDHKKGKSDETATAGHYSQSSEKAAHEPDIFDEISDKDQNVSNEKNPFHFRAATGNSTIAQASPSNNSQLEHSARSLISGTQVCAELSGSGHGVLTAVNGSALDAVVIVSTVGSDYPLNCVYVKKHSEITFRKLDAVSYNVTFSTGLDWDKSSGEFTEDASYIEFGKILTFSEYEDSHSIHYDHHTITLNVVPTGNVESRPINPEKFHALLQRGMPSFNR